MINFLRDWSARKKWFALVFLLCFVFLLLQYVQLEGRVLSKMSPSISIKNSSRQTIAGLCKQIMKGKPGAVEKAHSIMDRFPKRAISPQEYINLTRNCWEFKHTRGYILEPLTKNEEEFPIAFYISIYKDIEQFERLLRAIYRPQNFYCIHADKKAPNRFHLAVRNISKCFPNVFLSSETIEVIWGSSSILQSGLVCLKDLWKRSKSWKYFMYVTGQEFPLKTNNELVQILQNLKGKSIVHAKHPPETSSTSLRYLYVHKGVKRTKIRKKPFRENFTFYKGSAYVVLSRAFVEYILHDELAKDFLEWVYDTGKPEETYYQTLYVNVDFDKNLQDKSHGTPSSRYVIWENSGRPCYGKIVRQVCIFGLRDLKGITRKRALFVNKFHLNYQYLALDCMELWLRKRTLAPHQSYLSNVNLG